MDDIRQIIWMLW